ncbi:hypothetical protein [Brevifollis gellanilyticus]|nr:hypothetical protein [Brevifollis gellanilyticus]
MKFFILLAITFLLASTGFAETLVTKSFVVVIVHNDPEGVVSSDNITYVGVSRKTGKTIQLKGRTVHKMEADGVTPDVFRGYLFENDGATYWVGRHGELTVKSKGRVILEESGEWQD